MHSKQFSESQEKDEFCTFFEEETIHSIIRASERETIIQNMSAEELGEKFVAHNQLNWSSIGAH